LGIGLGSTFIINRFGPQEAQYRSMRFSRTRSNCGSEGKILCQRLESQAEILKIATEL